jgi:signal transduction histidine kinase
MIEQNFDYIEQLVKDTLNIARLDAGTVLFEPKETDLKIIVDNVISTNEVVFSKKGIKVVNNVSSTQVFCDTLRIKEVLENIIMNSIKFMENEPKVLTFYLDKDNDFFTLTVQDTGIGIEQKNLPLLFEDFMKLDTARHEHSSGLGLAICKRIIEKHQGSIWAESDGLGKGTRIRFSLPRNVQFSFSSL